MTKRVFIGLQAEAPWPDTFPEGRLLDEKDRHLTLNFLGSLNDYQIEEAWKKAPPLPEIGYGTTFDQMFFTPHVVGWHSIHPDGHVTLARSPYSRSEWEKAFIPLPVLFYQLHLYESLGYSQYHVLKTHATLPPFEELEHTADIAFKVRGQTLDQLAYHAYLALAFRDPHLLKYPLRPTQNLTDVITELNRVILSADADFGTPFKAVSHHGLLEQEQNHHTWEMIVDV